MMRYSLPILSFFLFFGLVACGPMFGPAGLSELQNRPVEIYEVTHSELLSEPSQCRLGGVQVARGFDVNHNRILDPDEVVSLMNLCEGLPAQRGLSHLANDAHADHC